MLAEALAALDGQLRMAIDVKDPAAADAVLSEVRNQEAGGRVLFWAKSPAAVALAAVLLIERMKGLLIRITQRPLYYKVRFTASESCRNLKHASPNPDVHSCAASKVRTETVTPAI
jgi:hypothetical protein